MVLLRWTKFLFPVCEPESRRNDEPGPGNLYRPQYLGKSLPAISSVFRNALLKAMNEQVYVHF